MTNEDNTGHSAGRSARWTRACVALLEYPTVDAAARAIGVAERTLRRYLANPDFLAMLAARQQQALDLAASRLTGLVSAAVDTLAEMLRDPNAPHGVRVHCAEHILSHAATYQELVDLAPRVHKLERLIGADDDA